VAHGFVDSPVATASRPKGFFGVSTSRVVLVVPVYLPDYTIRTICIEVSLEYSSTYNEHPLFFPLNPLHNPIRALRKRSPRH